jgi:hypothetical protein
MKTNLHLLPILAMVIALLTSCADNNPSNPLTASTLKNGTWKITYYYDSDHEETSSFNGYNFTFGSNDVVTATNGTTNVTGNWTTGSDDSQVELVLNFGLTVPFDELNDDWHVIELKDHLVRLEDVSGGSGTDYLNFTKN